jgi:hypothetical protein
MHDPALSRRRFLVAAATFCGCAGGGLGPLALRLSDAWAQAGADLGSDTVASMVAMARRLYPHDAIPDAVYAEVLDDVLTAMASSDSFAATLRAAEAALDAQQERDFIALDEAGQIAAMRAVQGMGFFTAIQDAVRFGLYNHPVVWAHLGYEGPSFAQGGYVNRGAGEIDWLPETD